MILVFLQNAWYRDLKRLPYDQWLISMWKSPTGRGLIKMLPEGVPYFVINSTDEIVDNSKEIKEADLHWMSMWIRFVKPKLILACGKVAQRGCYNLQVKYIKAPHPSWRGLTQSDIEKVKTLIKEAL